MLSRICNISWQRVATNPFLTTMVAVFIAVYVEGRIREWNLQELAASAREAVTKEIAQNETEFADSAPCIHLLRCRLEAIVEAKGRVGHEAVAGLAAYFPDISTAAWQAAQISAAGRYVDYEEWLLRYSPLYALCEEYTNAKGGFFDHFVHLTAWVVENGEAPGDPEELAGLARPVYGYLRILDGLHGQILSRLSNTLGDREPIRLPDCGDADTVPCSVAVSLAAERDEPVTSDQFKASLAEVRTEISALDTRLSTQITDVRAEIANLADRLALPTAPRVGRPDDR